MLAVRDQENLVHGHQQVAASKPLNQNTKGLQPKTPGNKYPKTPLKIPLNDENAPTAFGGKSAKGKGIENLVTGGKKNATFDMSAFVTPMGPRTRAPLGMKTTNAKAKGFQTPGPALEKDLEKTQQKPASTRRPKKIIHGDSVKLEIHGDESPLAEREVEYCPPKPKDLPYDSEDFPDGCLNYNVFKKGNMMRGIYNTYYNDLDENGMSRQDRRNEEEYQKSAAKADEQIRKMLEDDNEWTVGDVPETFRHIRKKQLSPKETATATLQPKKTPALPTKPPGTIASRNAVSALSVAPKPAPVLPRAIKPTPKPSFLSRKPTAAPTIPSNASTMRHAAATAASRSTIGYTKGRTALAAPRPQKTERSGLARSISNMSQSSDTTITPERFAEYEAKSPAFLKAFEIDDEDLEPGLRGILPECLRRPDDEDEEFVFTLGESE